MCFAPPVGHAVKSQRSCPGSCAPCVCRFGAPQTLPLPLPGTLLHHEPSHLGTSIPEWVRAELFEQRIHLCLDVFDVFCFHVLFGLAP